MAAVKPCLQLYKLAAADFHDITTGSSIGPSPTYSPGTGYDLATGLGSPVANLLIPQLVYPAQLAFDQSPTSAAAGAVLSPAVTVLVEDAAGNVVANDTSSVTLAIGNNLGGGTLSGTLTVTAVNGVATFNNLSIDNAGDGYTLVASDATGNGLLTVTSAPFTIVVPPTVASAASASQNPVSGTSTSLSVLGADHAGESDLTYTWTTTGTPPAEVTFSANDSNAAKNTTATFAQAGNYALLVTITDAGGLSTTSSVTVDVSQTVTSITVQPLSGLGADGTEAFAATAIDQFDLPLVNQPQFTWSLIGDGTISGTGVFMPPYTTGSATIQATSNSVTGSDVVPLPGWAQWNGISNTSWNTVGSWTSTAFASAAESPGLRSLSGDGVVFDSAAGGTVNLDGVSPSLADVTFDSTASDTIAQGSGGTLQLANGASPATLTIAAGSPTISAPLTLESNVTVIPAAGSQLTIPGGVGGAGC